MTTIRMKKRMMVTILSLSILVTMDSFGSHRIYGEDITHKRATNEIVHQQGEDTAKELPKSFDLRQQGKVTSVKNQTPWPTCGTFGAIASFESNYLVQNPSVKDIDLSELQVAWNLFTPQTKESLRGNSASESQVGEGNSPIAGGNAPLNQTSDPASVVSQLATWQGAALESDIPYQAQSGDSWAVPAGKRTLSAVQLKNAIFLPRVVKFGTSQFHQNVVDDMKKLIMKNGALAVIYSYKPQTYNATYQAQYNGTIVNTNPNHEVSIVGWDDNFSQAKFNKDPGVQEGDGFYAQPPGPGAWLVKNQWGSEWGDHGYFWLSYYDVSYTGTTSFISQPVHTYDKNYQYDYIGLSSKRSFHSEFPSTDEVSYANVFTIDSDEQLQAVSATLNDAKTSVRTRIYKLPYQQSDPNLKPIPNGVKPLLDQMDTYAYAGYYTVPLKNPIDFKKGDVVSVVQTLSSINASGQRVYQNPVEVGVRELNGFRQRIVIHKNESFRIHNGKQEDILYLSRKDNAVNGNAMIKAFTTKEKAVKPAALTSFTYQAYDGKDQPINSPVTNTDITKDTLALPQGSASIKLTDVQAVNGKAKVLVNGSPYTLGTKIDRGAFTKTTSENPIKIVVSGSDGTTLAHSYAFTTTPLVLTQDNVSVKDNAYYLQANTQLRVTKITANDDYEAVKAALAPIGGADNFVLRTISLQPAFDGKESVNLSITLDAQFHQPHKTALYYVDKTKGSLILTEVGNTSKDPNIRSADVSKMGEYVLAEVRDVPSVPTLAKITYDPGKTLADIKIPKAQGGTWRWDDEDIVPTVDKTSYAATFTPSVDSNYRSYKANIVLTTKKANVTMSKANATGITYGQTLHDSTLQGKAMLAKKPIAGTLAWKDATLMPTVKDANTTTYGVVFTPTDQVNYNRLEYKQTLPVAKKAITMSIKDATKVYGDANPAFTYTLEQGALVGKDTQRVIQAVLTSQADEKSAVGTSAITGHATADNYAISVQPATLTITKRPLGILVDAISLPYGVALPADFAYSLTNLVNGDTKEDVNPMVEIGVVDGGDTMLAGSYEVKVKKFTINSNNYVATTNHPSTTLTITPNTSTNVINNSSMKDVIANRFKVSGNIMLNSEIRIHDVTDQKILDAFAAITPEDKKMASVFDIAVATYHATNGKLTIYIPVDATYNNQKVSVLHYVEQEKPTARNDGSKAVVPDVYQDLTVVNGMVQIDVDALSPFALLVPKESVVLKPQASIIPTKPHQTVQEPVTIEVAEGVDTADNTAVFTLFVLMLLSCSTFLGIVIYKKKQTSAK